MPKISVVGAGNVGASAALYAAEAELGDITLIDILEGVAKGKALDLLEAGPVRGYDSMIEGSGDLRRRRGFARLLGSAVRVSACGPLTPAPVLDTAGAMLAGGTLRNCLPSSSSPPTPAAAAPTAVIPAARRNLRRSTVPVIVSSSGCRRVRA